MFGRLESQERLAKMGTTLDRAMSDIQLIVQHPQYIMDVSYVTDEDDKTQIFDKVGQKKFIRLTIDFTDPDGEIKKSRKDSVSAAEAELLRELEELKKEKSKYE